MFAFVSNGRFKEACVDCRHRERFFFILVVKFVNSTCLQNPRKVADNDFSLYPFVLYIFTAFEFTLSSSLLLSIPLMDGYVVKGGVLIFLEMPGQSHINPVSISRVIVALKSVPEDRRRFGVSQIYRVIACETLTFYRTQWPSRRLYFIPQKYVLVL